MKRLSMFVTGILITSAVTACGSQQAPLMDQTLVPAQVDQGVSTLSRKGLSTFYTSLVTRMFKAVDINHDQKIDSGEYGNFRFSLSNGGFMSSISMPSESQAARSESTTKKKQYTMDFAKTDKNKDGGITLAEAKKSYYFLGASKTDFRNNFVRPNFNMMNLNKDKYVSSDEFVKYLEAFSSHNNDPDAAQQTELMKQTYKMIFLVADKNVDQKLSFSEFEDMLYNSSRLDDLSSPNQSPPSPIPDPAAPSSVPESPAPVDPGQPSAAPESPSPEQPEQPVPVESTVPDQS